MNRPEKPLKTPAFLSTLPLFRELDQDEINRIAAGTMQIELPRGSVLFRRGDQCSGFHVVLYGQVKLVLQASHGNEKIIGLIGPGQSFGEAVMFLEKPYMVTAVTLADSKLLHVARDAVFAEIDNDPRLARRMLASLSMRLHHLIGDLESYTLQSGTQRIIAYLLSLSGKDDAGQTKVDLPAPKNVIASRLNLTQEHFSRILRDLVAARVIEMNGRTIRIVNSEKFRHFGN